MIANLGRLGKTVFLTTHYMEEAQRLADRVAIIAAGEIVAEGTPDELGEREQRPATITFRLPAGVDPGELPGEASASANGAVEISTTDPVGALNALTGWALARSVNLEGLECRRPSLEDVYLELTGGETSEAAEVES